MAKDNFERVVMITLGHEGGYVDHPDDPGGATNRGVTHKTLADWRGHGVTKSDVRNLSLSETKAIYRAKYWNIIQADGLPEGVDLALFDFAVNSGTSRAVKFVQRIVGTAPDGVMGPVTLAAINRRDPERLVCELTRDRMEFLSKLPTWPTFGRGWQRRVNDVSDKALVMCEEVRSRGKVPPPPDIEPLPATPTPAAPSRGLWAALKAFFGKAAA